MKKGFTLIELIAVIVILGIIALIAAPITINILKDAEDKSNIQNVNNLVAAAKTFQSNSIITKENLEKIDGITNILSLLEYDGEHPQEGFVYMQDDGEVLVNVKYDNRCYAKDFYTNEVVVTDPVNDECEIDMTYNINHEVITVSNSGFSNDIVRLLTSSDITRLFTNSNDIDMLNSMLEEVNTSFTVNGLTLSHLSNNSIDPQVSKKDYKVKTLGLKKDVKATQMAEVIYPSFGLMLYFDPTSFSDKFLFSFDIGTNNPEEEAYLFYDFIPKSKLTSGGAESGEVNILSDTGEINVKTNIKNANEPYIIIMQIYAPASTDSIYVNNFQIGTSCLKEATTYVGSTISKNTYVDDGIIDSNGNELNNIRMSDISTNLPNTPSAGKFEYTYRVKTKKDRMSITKKLIAGMENVLEVGNLGITINDYPNDYYAVIEQCYDEDENGSNETCYVEANLGQNSYYYEICELDYYIFKILDIKTDNVIYSRIIENVGNYCPQ